MTDTQDKPTVEITIPPARRIGSDLEVGMPEPRSSSTSQRSSKPETWSPA